MKLPFLVERDLALSVRALGCYGMEPFLVKRGMAILVSALHWHGVELLFLVEILMILVSAHGWHGVELEVTEIQFQLMVQVEVVVENQILHTVLEEENLL